MIGLLLLKHIYALSDEEVCERWVENPYFQFFTGEEFFQHAFPHERSVLRRRFWSCGSRSTCFAGVCLNGQLRQTSISFRLSGSPLANR